MQNDSAEREIRFHEELVQTMFARRSVIDATGSRRAQSLRPLWELHRRNAIERLSRFHQGFYDRCVAIAGQEALILQWLDDDLGEDLVPNYILAEGEYTRMNDDDRDAALREFIVEFTDEDDEDCIDITGVVLLAINDGDGATGRSLH